MTTIVNKSESVIQILHTWFTDNGTVLNEDKCQFLVMQSGRRPRSETVKVNMQSNVIEEVEKGKLQDVTIDKSISMNGHVRNIT